LLAYKEKRKNRTRGQTREQLVDDAQPCGGSTVVVQTAYIAPRAPYRVVFLMIFKPLFAE